MCFSVFDSENCAFSEPSDFSVFSRTDKSAPFDLYPITVVGTPSGGAALVYYDNGSDIGYDTSNRDNNLYLLSVSAMAFVHRQYFCFVRPYRVPGDKEGGG